MGNDFEIFQITEQFSGNSREELLIGVDVDRIHFTTPNNG